MSGGETAVGQTEGARPHPVQALRNLVWSHGFRPMPVYSGDFVEPKPEPDKPAGRPKAGKAPLGREWEKRARQDPPECIRLAAVVDWAQNTGILCDGLRAVDLDIDDPAIAGKVQALAIALLGTTIVRTRGNSPRCLLVYRAAEGEPPKQAISGASHDDEHACKVEVLGRGQQFVAYGGHPSGAELQWLEGGPADQDLAGCPAVTETQVHAFLVGAAALIDAPPPPEPGKARPERSRSTHGANGEDHGPPTADLFDVSAALRIIPNDGVPDWEYWNKVGMAIFAATEGTPDGCDLWLTWSAKNAAYDEGHAFERWDNYRTSPPNQTGAGKLFALAGSYSEGWKRPSGIGVKRNGNGSYHPEPEPSSGPGEIPWPEQAPEGPAEPDEREAPAEPEHELPVIYWEDQRTSDWAGRDVPDMEWIIPEWIPAQQVTGFYGIAGIGKTDFLLQLSMARSRGLTFLGYLLQSSPVYGLYCEDTKEQLIKRIDRIALHYGLTRADFPDFHWASLVGYDEPELMIFDQQNNPPPRHTKTPHTSMQHVTDALIHLDKKVLETGARLVTLDMGDHFFGGDDIRKRDIIRFIRKLDGLSISRGFGLVLSRHPSQRGRAVGGRQEAGSVAWEGSVRARLGIDTDHVEETESDYLPEQLGEVRKLIRWKSNYSQSGVVLDLVYRKGVFTPSALDPEQAALRANKPAMKAACQEKFIDLLRKLTAIGKRLSDSASHPSNYAPVVFAEHPEGRLFRKDQYKLAMRELEAAGQLRYVVRHGARHMLEIEITAPERHNPG